MTQEQLAERLGVSRQAVGKWEAGKARPTAEKQAGLSEVLGIPPEAWAAAAAERAAEQEAPAVRAARRWRRRAAVLTVLLCLSLAADGVLLWCLLGPVPEGEAAQQEEQLLPADTSYMFPQRLELSAKQVEDFGDMPLSAGSGGDAPTAEGGTAETVFIDQFPHSSWLQVVRANPIKENNTVFYEVCVSYLRSIFDDQPVQLGSLIGYNHYVGDGLDDAAYVENVLGYDCWKISLSCGAACVMSWYFTADMDTGMVRLLLSACGTGAAEECDVDGDGELEVVTTFGLPMAWTIYDTTASGRCVACTLDQDGYGTVPLSFSPEEGFVVTDDTGAVMARYLLEENCLKRQPVLSFSLRDYPDAAGTELTFLTEAEISDGKDPDAVIDNGTVRTTHRQQALLALQTLYDLTGLKLECALCAAGKDGVGFYTEDGENCFYNVTWGKRYGGEGFLSGLSIVWMEEADWSPLAFSQARHLPASITAPEQWLKNTCRDDLPLFCDGQVLTVAADPQERYEKDRYVACRADGSYYAARLLETDTGYALASFYGPYPALGTAED